jgi:hemerythrin-like metal-binding protein
MKYLFEWTPAISVYDETIDGQHQRLLGQVNTLLSYIIAEKDPQIVNDAVSFLDQYIKEHFSYEEIYMRENNYPDIDAHMKLHGEFINNYKRFKEKLNAGVSKDSLALEIEQYIGNWWLTHIAVEDHKYADFIKNKK